MARDNKADLLVLGNVITMDEHKPRAEAVAVKSDKIMYVGSAEVARKLCDEDTKVIDYGENSVYPGFLEAHCHPGGAGAAMALIVTLDPNASLEEDVEVMRQYVQAHPEKQVVQGMGFQVRDVNSLPDAGMLDAICPDRPMVLTSVDGHSMWINTRAMQEYGVDRDAAARYGEACVKVDTDGNPTGFLSEGMVFVIRGLIESTVAELEEALLAWQGYALSMGYTGVYNAGVELVSAAEPLAYYELERKGLLKHYTFAGSLVADNTDTPEADMDRIAAEAEAHNSKHYRILGAKAFCDGVIEAHTGWMLNEYLDQPGYFGVSRFDDHDKIVRLVKAAAGHNMNVHVHTIGDAASKAWADGIAEAEEATGNFDMRCALAHLQAVDPDVIPRFGEYNIVAVCGILWTMKTSPYFEQEVSYVGQELAQNAYPTKSFADAGAVVVSHSDFPVSPSFSAPWTVVMGTQRWMPSFGEQCLRNADQALTRMDALKTITTNVAWSWHAEDRMGSLEVGKLANMAVFDKDFLADDLAEVEQAQCLATFVDGELVYEA